MKASSPHPPLSLDGIKHVHSTGLGKSIEHNYIFEVILDDDRTLEGMMTLITELWERYSPRKANMGFIFGFLGDVLGKGENKLMFRFGS